MISWGRKTNRPLGEQSTSHSGQKFNDAFQVKRGSYTDLSAAKITEMMHSSSLDNAPTQSLLRVVNDILDESIERKRGEMPHRVVYLLRNVIQEIEHRFSIQADHTRNQNNVIKTREDKYRSKIKALETLVNGTNVENEMTINPLELVEIEKSKLHEKQKLGKQDMVQLIREKESAENRIASLQQEIQVMSRIHEQYREKMETETRQTEELLTMRVKEAEFQLMQSKKKAEEIESASQLNSRLWSRKANYPLPYRQKTPSRIARMFLNKNGPPANSKPKPRESALKPPGRTRSAPTRVTGGRPAAKPPKKR